MCGISIIINSETREVSDHDIRRMNRKIAHRGPDGEGYFVETQIAMGHRALSITDVSPASNQPMKKDDYVLVFNGEIYNYKALKSQLSKEGYHFVSNTDTEVILAAYQKWGTRCTHYFNGMWAFALYDKKKQQLFCSRDRFGIKPFCYTSLGNKFLAGSEIKQFTVFEEFKPLLNNEVAANFLYNGKIDGGSQSFFQNVYFLPPGHQLIYDLTVHSFVISQWYSVDNLLTKPDKLNFDEAVPVFREFFTGSILEHTRTSLEVGACLSGGLDSTSVAGIAHKISKPITTFSTCYVQHGYNEIRYINDALTHYGYTGQKIYPNINDLAVNGLLRKITYHQDQPILSGSFFSEYKVFEAAAHKNIRIVLSGQGADEYLGGYNEFSLLALLCLLKKCSLGALRQSIHHLAASQNNTARAIFNQLMVLGVAGKYTKAQEASLKRKSAYSSCFKEDWLLDVEHKTLLSEDIASYRNLSKLSKDALTAYSLPHQLHSEDRNSMMHGIESRLPFLDHRLVEWCLSLPNEHIVRYGHTKAILREAMKGILPKTIYNRHSKLGFPGPEEQLFNHHYQYAHHQFQEYIHLFPAILSKQLLSVFSAFHSGKIPYNPLFFRILSFGAWAKEFEVISDNSFVPAKKESKRLIES